MAQQLKNPESTLLGLGFNPWPRNFHMLQAKQKKKKKKGKKTERQRE